MTLMKSITKLKFTFIVKGKNIRNIYISIKNFDNSKMDVDNKR